jgi:hypothetical protein
MSYEAVRWALYDAPTLLTAAGKPDTAARFVLVARAERADKHGRNTYAGTGDIIKATGFDERTIERAERRLEKAGLLVRAGFSQFNTVRWNLDMSQKQSDGNQAFVEARLERRRQADAERKRRQREREKAAASIDGHVRNENSVTDSASVTSRTLNPDVTDSVTGCHGRSAPQTTLRTTHEPPAGTTPGGTLPPDPLRPPSPSAPGTYSQNPLNGPLTPAQDQQRNSRPRTRAANEAGPGGGLIVDFFTREAM